jgi:post-segregation antitoxin (ccd killing protein)
MGEYVTVSVKVKRELLDEARRLNINVSELIRSALENEVRRRKLMLLEEKLKTKKSILEKIDVDRVVRLIREDRGRLDK